MTKEELIARLGEIETAICEARIDLEELAGDCNAMWLEDSPEGETFWENCATAMQEKADAISEVEDWLFEIKEGETTIEDAINE